jgi:hypothetical protein
VPTFIPCVPLYRPAQRPFDFQVVARREFYGVTVVLVTPFPIEVAEHVIQHGTLELDPIWILTALVGAATFLVSRAAKKARSLATRRQASPAR